MSNSPAWDRAATTYGEVGPPYFAYFGRRMVEYSALKPGGTVLDVACGKGAVLFPAAAQVGAQGQVVGIDYSPEMVRLTAAEISARGITNAQVRVMDGGNLDFPDATFDAVLCGFALFFLPDLPAALRGFRRVLKPGGTLAVSTWGPGDERWNWLGEVMPRTTPEKPGPQLGKPEVIAEVLAGAGFSNIGSYPEERAFNYSSPAEWWTTSWSHGCRIQLEQLTAEQQQQAQSRAFKHLRQMQAPDASIPQLFRALFTVANS